jgi:hypothetical protein
MMSVGKKLFAFNAHFLGKLPHGFHVGLGRFGYLPVSHA